MVVSLPSVFADMQISANTSVKTIEGHARHAFEPSFARPHGHHRLTPCSRFAPPSLRPQYTCHTKSVITKPQNVYVMRDIMCSGYVAGGNCRWFGAGSGSNTLGGDNGRTPVSNEDFAADLNARLSFEDDSSGEYASMMAFACPYNEVENASRDQVISISERLLPWEVAKNADPAKKYFPGGEAGFKLYNSKWALGQIHFGEDVRATESMSFMSQVQCQQPVPCNSCRMHQPRTDTLS